VPAPPHALTAMIAATNAPIYFGRIVGRAPSLLRG